MVTERFQTDYTKRPWGEFWYVCSECCDPAQPSRGLAEDQRYEEGETCAIHGCEVEPFWSRHRIAQYFVSLSMEHGDRFFVLGLFEDEKLRGFVTAFPLAERGACYLDFITLDPEFRRVKGVRAWLAAALLVCRYRYFRHVPFLGALAGRFLERMSVPSMELMREFFRALVRQGYDSVYARIITARTGLRRNMYIIGFDSHRPCTTDPKRTVYRRSLEDIAP